MLFVAIALFIIAFLTLFTNVPALGIIWIILCCILWRGFRIIHPEEALVLVAFGQYKGTMRKPGFYYVNPFARAFNPAAGTVLGQSGDVKNDQSGVSLSNRISLKVMTLSNTRQKINDAVGNPVEISVAVIWRVVDTAKAVFAVDNYKSYLSLQCDAAVRNVVRLYPYDIVPGMDEELEVVEEGSLRGSSEQVAERIRQEIQSHVEVAGIEILEARITYLAYAPEIAAVMLKRQQANAVIDARATIVDGAVSIVDMALKQLEEGHIVDLDPDRKAAMVSNLLLVLCGDQDAQPVINTDI